MKILTIDYITYYGHRNFNKIHVSSLCNLGHNLTLIARKTAIDVLDESNCLKKYNLPEWSTKPYPFASISERIKGIILLFWIRLNFKLSEYDAILFLSYDVMSLYFFRTQTPTFLINHNNVAQLNKLIKYKLTKWLPSNYEHVVLTLDSKERLEEILRKEVYYVPHGFVDPSLKMNKPSFLDKNEAFLFCPVNRWYDKELITSVIESKNVNDYLKKNNIKLVLKQKLYSGEKKEVIVLINNNIQEDEYYYMMKNALAVILPYNDEFKYRSSGIMFECVAFDEPIIASSIPAIKTYDGMLKISFFKEPEDFVKCIEKVQNGNFSATDNTNFIPDLFWNRILN